MSVENDFSTTITGIVSDASNVLIGNTSSYQLSDFQTMHPEFGSDGSGNYLVPVAAQQVYINLAVQSINQARWQSNWYIAVGLYAAHLCALYLQRATNPSNGASAVFEGARAQGVINSESVGDVSYSADVSIGSTEGWGAWNLTVYGQQLAAFGKIMGKGGMYIY